MIESTLSYPDGRTLAGIEPAVLGWGSALPEYSYDQAEVAEHLARDLDARRTRRLRAAFRGSGVVRRFSVLPDFEPGRESWLFANGVPTTAERLDVYREQAPTLAEAAAQQALAGAGLAGPEITHLLFITCTGFAAPGPDQELIERLELPLSVRRVQIGFQGCSAGLVALRTAGEIVRGDSSARVLVVAVELSTLHFQADPVEADLRGHALFADGSGAAVVGAPGAGTGNGVGRIVLGRGRSRLVPGVKDAMTWRIGDTGFRMQLTSQVPEALAEAIPGFVEELRGDSAGDFRHWAVHPGGPAILDHIGRALDLEPEVLSASREVLRTCGNMSSATIFFVLERIAREASPGTGVALAFGPGLTADGLTFELLDPGR
jgi:predicted naringenin-chalcone synthase